MHSSVEETYKKVSQIEHVLLRPDTYIGSVRQTEEMMWVTQGDQLVHKKITYVPGLYKIFDEILVNAADNFQRDKKMKEIDVRINREEVSISNDGKGIPVQIHKKHKIYVPELIFGHLLTSSNYEDNEKKVVGGRNGYGAKLANLFSSSFDIEIADSLNKKLYKQTWKKNMGQMSQPLIKNHQGEDYTKITFRPDFHRFGVTKFSQDMINLMKRRVYDISGILKVKVYLNGKSIKISSFKQYAKMFMEDPEQPLIEVKERSGRWHVLACRSDGEMSQISFVNAISTSKGGTHVNYITDQIVKKLMEILTKKKSIKLKPFQIKSHLSIFINCLIQNPCFSSQSKETLTTQASHFGSSCSISDEFIRQLLKSGIGQKILNEAKAKENNKIERQLKKAKKNRLIIPKLQDANEAGRSNKCCLILTEGDSAKALALCGIQQLGRDYFGVFPLRGKLANARQMESKKVMQNAQLSSIVKILGLSFGKSYSDTNSLRYSSVMIMADQDTDGSHIKGLVINFFQRFWPSLCQIDGFLKEFITPIIKCKKGSESINFYSLVDYNKWKSENDESGWSIKYYKGLGTSTSKQAKQYFQNLSQHQKLFTYKSEQDRQTLSLAFDKKNPNERKKWLQQYDIQVGINHKIKKITIEDFVNKELIHFSNQDNVRSIASVMYGLKPSQRKILFACFKRNLNNQIKVAQLAGYVAQHSAYHHGEQSLCMAITSMAQNFVGSNNLNLLEPLGQFGTRYEKGKDHASARYIFTKLNPLTRYLFKQQDNHVVEYQNQDNQSIQPVYYLPILPMVLINGAEGIGTGWSTTIYPHKVLDVIKLMKDKLKGKERDISIGWQNYKGSIERIDRSNFSISGQFQVDDETVVIRQIPVNKGIRDYKSFLQQKLQSQTNNDPDLQDLKEYHNNNTIQFVLKFFIEKQPSEREMLKYLKLTSNCQLNNMHLFNPLRKITKYQTIQQIVEEFYQQRIKGYCLRKKYLISKFKKESFIISNQIRFIKEIINGSFKFIQSKQQWIFKLREGKYSRFQELNQIHSTKNKEEDQNEKNRDFSYLLNMPIWSFCEEKIRDMTSVKEQLNTIINYYQNITEKQMWIKDIEQFQDAWNTIQEGKQVKHTNSRRNQISQSKKTSKKRRTVAHSQQSDDDQEKNNSKKKTTRKSRNLMEQEVQKVTEQKIGRKKLKKDDEPEVLSQIKPMNLQIEQKAEQKSGFDAILSKYLSKDDQKQGELTLLNRIKSRITNNNQSFNTSYKEAKEELSASKKQEDKNVDMDEDDDQLRKYLL